MISSEEHFNENQVREYLAGLRIQVRVARALMIREMMVHFGRSNIGFLWLVVEPMLLCAGVVALRWLIQSHQEQGVSLVAMVLSGYMPLTLWRHLTNKSIFILRRNAGMLYHRHITLLDVFSVKMIVEFIGCTFAFIVNYFALLVIGVLDPIRDYGLVIEGWLLMGLLALGFAAMIATLTERFEVADKFIQPLQYLTMPICGTFYLAVWLPDHVRELALWIPLLHCFEIVRAGFFGDAVTTYYSAAYPFVFGLAFLAVFLPLFEKVRDHIEFA